MSLNPTSGLRVAHAAVLALLERFQGQLSPREYSVLVDLLLRRLEAERARHERARKRWAA